MAQKTALNHLLKRLPTNTILHVGLSGGLDSKVLLHYLQQKISSNIHLQAIHFQHDLEDDEALWIEDCQHYCAHLNIPLKVLHYPASSHHWQGMEANARYQRLQGYFDIAAEWAALGHHANDRAETLLHRLLRGSGRYGLAAMPAESIFHELKGTAHPTGALHILRPLLTWSKLDIETYAAQYGICGADDPANHDPTHARTIIRKHILPLILQHYPSFLHTAGKTASLAEQDRLLFEDLASIDIKKIALSNDTRVLDRLAWLRLPSARRHNLLRYWLRQQIQGMKDIPENPWPSYRRLNHLSAMLIARNSGQVIPFSGIPFRLQWQRQRLECVRHFTTEAFCPKFPTILPLPLNVENEGEIVLSVGTLRWYWRKSPSTIDGLQSGIGKSHLQKATVWIDHRRPGDFFRPAHNRPRRPLRKWMGDVGLPTALRPTWPVVRLDPKTMVVACANLGTQAEYLPKQLEEPQLTFIYTPFFNKVCG